MGEGRGGEGNDYRSGGIFVCPHTLADLRNHIGKITNTDWGVLGNSIIDFLNDVYSFVLFKGRKSSYP